MSNKPRATYRQNRGLSVPFIPPAIPPMVLFHATFFRRDRHLMHDTPTPSRARS
jgi:hypothetical protein